ncbi:MAG TPA: RDD family protein [Pilimelia sp.]|nr:RDD family protein [Pilimelia sp.]
MTEPAARAYAGVVSRTVAFVVDVVIVGTIAGGTVLFVELIGFVMGAQARDLARALVPVFVAAVPALLAFYGMFFWAMAGRTPGMALLGIRVVTTTGRQRISWLSALIRAVTLTLFPIGALWCVVDRRCQGVHDKLARTTVVHAAALPTGSRTPRPAGGESPPASGASVTAAA